MLWMNIYYDCQWIVNHCNRNPNVKFFMVYDWRICNRLVEWWCTFQRRFANFVNNEFLYIWTPLTEYSMQAKSLNRMMGLLKIISNAWTSVIEIVYCWSLVIIRKCTDSNHTGKTSEWLCVCVSMSDQKSIFILMSVNGLWINYWLFLFTTNERRE